MTPERHQQIQTLFNAALELEPHERTSFISRVCAGDENLRADLQSLLDSHERAGQFIAAPAFEIAAKQISEQSPPSLAGKRLGHYEIVSLLGAGGMGEVYLARDRRLGRKAAVKVLSPNIAANLNLMQRFATEAQTASQLNHPNIATIYDAGEADGIRFIAMEYIEGVTLAAKISSHELSVATALDLAIQIADGLDAAHTLGIAHRDIKPENIMVRPDGRIKILDFGLAKLTEPAFLDDAPTRMVTATQAGLVLGTVRYMSPEQARGEKLDARTDIFSFGIVLYEMISGSTPFPGDTASDVLASILTRDVPPLAQRAREVPAELERIIQKALRKSREERYQNIRDMLVDLKALRPVSTVLPMPARPARTWLRALPVIAAVFIVVAALGYFFSRRPTRDIDSLAVLPFTNVTGDRDSDYLSDGISDSLINNLSQASKLKVVSLSSVLRFRGQQIDAQDVGRELKVGAVVMGRLTRRGDTLVINAELVDATDNRRIWGEQYDRKTTDVLQLQADISKEISRQLRLKLSGAEEQRLARSYTRNSDAYKAYLQGHYLWSKFTVEGVRSSIPYYLQAIEKDPQYALAYSSLADSYVVIGLSAAPPNEVFPKAKAAATKALELDPSLGAAHISLGAYKLFYEWDWAGAEQEARRARELNPSYDKAIELNTNYGDGNHYYFQYLDVMGRSAEAIQEMTRALEFDPLAFVLYGEMGMSYYIGRHYPEAIEASRKALEKDPNIAVARQALGNALQQQGHFEEAIAELTKARTASNDDPWMLADLANANAAAGKKAEALALLHELQERAKGEYVSPYFIALVYVGLGDKDQALQWLQKAYQERSALLTWLKVEPKLDSLRSDPRFQELQRRVGFS